MKTQTESIYPVDYTIENLYYFLSPSIPDGYYNEKEAIAYHRGSFDMLQVLYDMKCLDWFALKKTDTNKAEEK